MTQTQHIWNDFYDRLFYFVNHKVQNKMATEDILQDVFIKIHTNLPSLSQQNKLTSWVYQITRNSLMDYFRKQNKTQEVAIEELEKVEKPIIEDEAEKILEFERCLLPLINILPEQYKDAIMKTELGNLSQKEYAEELGISYSGTKSRVQRAKKQLKGYFIEYCQVELDTRGKLTPCRDEKKCSN